MVKQRRLLLAIAFGCNLTVFGWVAEAAMIASAGTVIYEGSLDGAQLQWVRDADGQYTPLLPGSLPLAETDKPLLARQSLLLLVPWHTSLTGVEIVPLATHRETLPGPLATGGLLTSNEGIDIIVDRLPLGASSFPTTWGEYGGIHIFRGFRLLAVNLYPLRAVRDAGGRWSALEVLDRFAIRTVAGDVTATPSVAHRQRLVPGERQRTEAILTRVIANRALLAGYDRPDGDIVPEPVGGFQPARTPSLSGSSVSYLIITNSEMEPAFQVLADHKSAVGLPATVATVEWIRDNFRNGADLQETVRLFIRDAYEKWGIEFVLLGGDTDVIPARYATNTYYPPQGATEIPSDLYFGCLDGNWNADGDYVYGEHYSSPTYTGDDVDMADEVFVGRAPVSSLEAATLFVDKVITYSETAAGAAWANRALFAAEVLFWSENDSIITDGADFAEEIINSFLAPCTDMEYTRMYENYVDYPGSTPLTRAAFIDSLNSGHYGLVDQIGHGFFFNMSVGDANFTVADADALTNGDHLFVLYALNCASAAFDHSCLMERFLQNPYGGSIISIGSSRAAFPFTANGYQDEFYDHLFCQEAFRIGELISLSRLPFLALTPFNTVHRWTFLNYTMLGDPALPVWTAVPATVQVTAPGSLDAGQELVDITVQSEGEPVAGALVCLTKDGEDYVFQTTSPLGQTTLPFTATSSGDALLTITGGNLELTSLALSVNTGSSFIAVTDMTIIDDGSDGSVGNGNGIAEAGETLAIYALCQDTGGGGAIGCIANLIVGVSGVTIIDDEAVVGDVPPGGTKLSDEPFLISLDTSLADGSLTTFDLVVIDADDTEYESERSLTALAPEIEPVELTWSDALYGNGNGILENGERATFTVTLKNFGAGLADRVTGFLRSVDPQVTLYDTLVVYDDIGLLEESTGGASFSLSDSDINSPFRCWIMFVDNYGRRVRHDFHLLPPPTPEGLMSDTSYGPDTITLQWLPIQLGSLRGYHVYRSEDEGGPFSRVNVDVIDRTSYYWDGGLQPLTRYYYRVTAVDSSLVEGPPSTVISRSTAPPELDNFPLPFGLETSSHCAVGDVNGDGRLEIVLGADEVYVWTNNGGELFDGDNNAQTHGPITNLAAQFQPAGITLAQLDHLPGLEIIASERDSQQIHIFRHDGSELAGWPQDLRHIENTGWNWASPAVGDMDGDGEPEIVVNSQDGRTWVWHVDGSELADGDNDPLTNGVFIVREGWNLEYGHSSPALFDLDGDNAKEIIFGTKYGEIQDNYLLAYRHDGSQAEGFPYNSGPGSIICSPTVADLNGDGTWEIIFQSQGNLLHVVQQDGSDYPGFPIAFAANTNFNPSPAVGDFDQDGQLEIAIVSTVSTQLTHLFIIDTDDVGGTAGQPLPGWPQPLPGNSEASPVVGDIDGDGLLDVIHGIGGGDEDSPNNLYAFKASGELVNGFPITLGGPLRPSPVICDLERDGDVDIVYGGWDNLIHVWDMPFAYDVRLTPWPTFRGHVFRDGVHRTLDLVDVPEPVVGVDLIVTQPFPNPFNPATSVRLYVPGPAGSTQQLEVRIYDLQGRKVRSLYDGPAATGWRTLVWDGRDENGRGQASGIYFLRTRSAGRSVIHKMALIK